MELLNSLRDSSVELLSLLKRLNPPSASLPPLPSDQTASELWEYERRPIGSGVWNAFGPPAQLALVVAAAKAEERVQFTVDGKQLEVNLSAMEQTNKSNGFKRPVRKVSTLRPERWEFDSGNGNYQSYSPAGQLALSSAAETGVTSFTLTINGSQYDFDLMAMKQTNRSNGFVRTIRKVNANPPMLINTISQAHQKRLLDTYDERLSPRGPISGVMQVAPLPLAAAVAQTRISGLDAFVSSARSFGEVKARTDPNGLVADEIGAIHLYTAECELYATLNRLLRAQDRNALKPFFPYMRLLLCARAKLPRYSGNVWRGVIGKDLRASYPKGKELDWWGFSSTTKQMSVLLNPTFLGQSGVRTVFLIEIASAVDIQRYSAFQGTASEAEVLIFPGTKLVVVDSMDMGNSLFQVHLREVSVPIQFFK
jgi:hypothetical protein